MRVVLKWTAWVILFHFTSAWAQSQYDLPGTIPLTPKRKMAEDLVNERGRSLSPEQAYKYKDPSLLNPEETDFWKKENLPYPPMLPLSQEGEAFTYNGPIDSLIFWLRMSVSQETPEGGKEFYQIVLSRNVQNVLLRARLLNFLGYRTPPLKYLKNFKVRFKSHAQRDDFININMYNALDAEQNRWIKNVQKVVVDGETQSGKVLWKVTPETEDCLCLELQDAVVFVADTHIYNLALGHVNFDDMLGRRALESLLIPFGFTQVPESVNMMSWHYGKVFNDSLVVPYEFQDEFYPSYYDAKWAARKLLQLSRKDWEEVVQFAQYPKPVELLVTEKIVSQRNDLISLFKFKNQFKPFSVNSGVSYVENGEKLLDNGKLLKKEYPGYAVTFAYGDPESPLSSSDQFAFLRSKVYSNILENLVAEVNLNWLPKTDLQKAIGEKQLELAVDQLIESIKQGKNVEIPFGTWTTPLADVQFIASREVIAGNILGTENPIQMSHTIGASARAGIFVGAYGMNPGWGASGKVQGYVTRTYSHLQPLRDIKAALEQPYKNIAVPFLAKDIGRVLDKVTGADYSKLSELHPKELEDMTKEVRKMISAFDQEFQVGESLIISDYVGGYGQVNVGYQFGQVNELDEKFSLQMSARSELKLVARLHIFRASDTSIHIYDDNGSSVNLNLGLNLSLSHVQILGLDFLYTPVGSAKTKFTQLNLDSKTNDFGQFVNSDLIDNLRIIYHLMLSFRKESLYAKREPLSIDHSFDQLGFSGNFLMNYSKYLRTMQESKIEYKGQVGTYVRHTRGFREGRDWEQFGLNVLNGVIQSLEPESNVVVNSQNSGDSGDSFYGFSKMRQVIFEGREKEGAVDSPFVMVERRWKGWEASAEKLQSILDEVNRVYENTLDSPLNLYRALDLKSTEKIQLFSVYLHLNVYERALLELTKVPRKKLELLFFTAAQGMPESPGIYAEDSHRSNQSWSWDMAGDFVSEQENYLEALKNGDAKKAAKAAAIMVNLGDEYFPWSEFLTLLGGPENIFIQSKVIGFRVGDEDIDEKSLLHRPFYSKSIGEFGSTKAFGPFSFVRGKLEVTEPEMFIYWIKEKL